MRIPRKIMVVSLAVAISLLGDAALYTVLPIHAEDLGIKLALVGVLLSVNRYVRLFTNPLAGHIHDSFQSSWPFLIALVVGALTTASYGLFWGFWIFFIARTIWGLCWSFIRLEGYTTVIIEATPQRRGNLMGFYQSIVGSGQMIGGFLGGVLTDVIGYRNCLLSFSGLILLGAFAISLEQWRSGIRPNGNSPPTYTPQVSSAAEKYGIQLSSSIPAPRRWMLYFMGFVNVLVNSSIIVSTLGRLLKVRFGMTTSFWRISIGVASATGALIFLRWLVSFLLAPTFGHISDRLGRRLVMILGLAIGILTLLCLATQSHFLWLSLAAVISSISATAISVSLDASVADVVGERRRGQFVSRYVTFTDLGSACGPLIGYLLLSLQVGLDRLYLSGLVLLIIASALYTAGKEKEPSSLN